MTTDRRYQIDFDALDVQSLRELVRLLRDLDHETKVGLHEVMPRALFTVLGAHREAPLAARGQ